MTSPDTPHVPSRQVPARATALLHEGWTVEPVGDGSEAPIPATVPGCVHTDLLASERIPDPFVDTNELDVEWVASTDWTYRTTIPAASVPTGCDRTDLVFDGLDTLAEISIDGVEIARTENMHRTYRFDVAAALAATGDHELAITFRSATNEAEARRQREGEWPSSSFGRPFNYVRKMACSWGWDWGPWLTTAGIWRRAALEAWSTARLAAVQPTVTVDADGIGTMRLAGRVERAGTDATELTIRVTLHGPDGAEVASTDATIGGDATEIAAALDAGTVQRWWPIGHGDQPLYRVTAELRNADAVIDTWSKRVGFRTIELDTSIDAIGSAFTFVVNGKPIFVRGVNWIPDDPFVTRVDAARYRTRLADAVEADVNLLRVWGGGIYESDDFYDACDELGLMVWQDFLFACAAYPEHLLADEVEAEARDNVERLMSHPSLVLWNGNNENIWGYFDWAWQPVLEGRPWGAGFYFGVLPKVVAEIDPTRPYFAGSPYSGTMDVHPNADANGCIHEWEVWNRVDYTRYRARTPRFVSEFGWQAPPTWATLKASITDDPLNPTSAGMLHHQKADDGNGKLERGLAHHVDLPAVTDEASMDRWLWAMRLTQARAVTTGIEHFRSLYGHCMGTIWWQLNDCWPVTSWAVVDSMGGRKPAWHALRAAYAPRLLTIQPRGDRLVAFAVNDTDEAWTLDLVAERCRFDGGRAGEATSAIVASPRSIAGWELPAEVAVPIDPTSEVLRVRLADADEDVRAWWWWAEDRDVAYPPAEITIEAIDDGLLVTAHTLVRDLALEADRFDPTLQAGTQLVTLLPGEQTVVPVARASDLAAQAATHPLWWTANDLTNVTT